MLGFIAENLRDGLTKTVQWHELPAELAKGAPSWSTSARRPSTPAAPSTVPSTSPSTTSACAHRRGRADDAIVHCQVGLRGYLAARTLAQHGRRVRNLDGGYRTWARM